MIEIKHRHTNEVLYTVPADTLSGADLSGANLSGANLRDADLSGAYLSGATSDLPLVSPSGLTARRNQASLLSGAFCVSAYFLDF